MPVYSHSRLSTYDHCPRQYKLKYVDKIQVPEAPEGIEAFLGLRVHETLAKLYQDLILSKLNSLEELLDHYSSGWDHNWHDNVRVLRKGFEPQHYRQAGIEALTRYYRRYHPFDQSQTLATEQPTRVNLDGYALRGFIDRLSHDGRGGYEIHDYKTSGSLPSQEDLDQDRQLALYQIGIQQRWKDAKEVRLVWHYLRFDQELTSERTDAQLEDLKGEVVSLIKTIEKDSQFEPDESRLCDWCEFPQYCPAKMHEIQVQDLPVNEYLRESGVSLVNQYAAVKAQKKELDKELASIQEAAIAYAKARGISKITGSEYTLRITQQTDWQFPGAREEDRDNLEGYLRKSGLWEQVSILELKRLKKALSEGAFDDKTIRALLEFAEEEEKVSVRLLKKRGEGVMTG